MTNPAKETEVKEIAAAAADEATFRGYVRSLTSPPESYCLSEELQAQLQEQLDLLAHHQLPLDHLKRALAYGEKCRMAPASLVYRLNSRPIDQGSGLLVHHLLGIITEAFELIPFLQLVLDQRGLDERMQEQLARELGDLQFYSVGAADELAYTMPEVRVAVMTKLARRYQNLHFTQKAAVDRDEAAE